MYKISLRPFLLTDAELVFQWRNDPYISLLGSTSRNVEWGEHYLWMQGTISNNNVRRAFIILLSESPIGQIRFDKESETDPHCVISVYLLKEFTGRGLGVVSIQMGCDEISRIWPNVEQVYAQVLQTNVNGQKAFLRAGFSFDLEHVEDNQHEFFIFKIYEIIPHNRITFDTAEISKVTKTLKSGYWASGNVVAEFEGLLKLTTKRTYAVAVSSGLSALRIALLSVGVKENDEVIVPAYSCVAIANAILAIGAKPVPVDINLLDLNIDIDCVERRINNRTAAIIVVHTFGVVADIKAFKRFGIAVIEDCAHSMGLEQNGIQVGNLGDMTICSFYATKLIGGGEGGAVLTNNEQMGKKAKDLRDYTDKIPSRYRMNDKMSNIHAAISLTQLNKLDYFLKRRKALASEYIELLKELKQLFPFIRFQGDLINSSWYRFILFLSGIDIDKVIHQMDLKKVCVRKPIELWISQEDMNSYRTTAEAYSSIISLPFYPSLSIYQQKRVIAILSETLTETYDG